MKVNVVVLIIIGYSVLCLKMNLSKINLQMLILDIFSIIFERLSHTITPSIWRKTVEQILYLPNWKWRRLFFTSSTRRTRSLFWWRSESFPLEKSIERFLGVFFALGLYLPWMCVIALQIVLELACTHFLHSHPTSLSVCSSSLVPLSSLCPPPTLTNKLMWQPTNKWSPVPDVTAF